MVSLLYVTWSKAAGSSYNDRSNVFSECWFSVSEKGHSPCILDLGRLETRFGKCDSQICCAAEGLDPEIMDVTGSRSYIR